MRMAHLHKTQRFKIFPSIAFPSPSHPARRGTKSQESSWQWTLPWTVFWIQAFRRKHTFSVRGRVRRTVIVKYSKGSYWNEACYSFPSPRPQVCPPPTPKKRTTEILVHWALILHRRPYHDDAGYTLTKSGKQLLRFPSPRTILQALAPRTSTLAFSFSFRTTSLELSTRRRRKRRREDRI